MVVEGTSGMVNQSNGDEVREYGDVEAMVDAFVSSVSLCVLTQIYGVVCDDFVRTNDVVNQLQEATCVILPNAFGNSFTACSVMNRKALQKVVGAGNHLMVATIVHEHSLISNVSYGQKNLAWTLQQQLNEYEEKKDDMDEPHGLMALMNSLLAEAEVETKSERIPPPISLPKRSEVVSPEQFHVNSRKDSASIRRFGCTEIVNDSMITLRSMLMRCEDFDRTGHCAVVHCPNAHVCREHVTRIAPKLDSAAETVAGLPPCHSYLPVHPIGTAQESDWNVYDRNLSPVQPPSIPSERHAVLDLISQVNSDTFAPRLPTGQIFICGASICTLGADCANNRCRSYHVLNLRVCKNSNVASICHATQPACCLNHSRSDIAKYCVHFNSLDCHKKDSHLPHRCLVCSAANHGSVCCPFLYGITSDFLKFVIVPGVKKVRASSFPVISAKKSLRSATFATPPETFAAHRAKNKSAPIVITPVVPKPVVNVSINPFAVNWSACPSIPSLSSQVHPESLFSDRRFSSASSNESVFAFFLSDESTLPQNAESPLIKSHHYGWDSQLLRSNRS